jgi:hypothetical protein
MDTLVLTAGPRADIRTPSLQSSPEYKAGLLTNWTTTFDGATVTRVMHSKVAEFE